MESLTWTAIFLSFIIIQINKQREIAACGQLQNILFSHISNGRDTHRWPWHAAIYHQTDTDSMYQCGGTLVSSTFILTAAHCVVIAAERISVSLGRLHLNGSQSSAPFIKVDEILSHPGYNPENNDNDIAIIALSTDAIFNNYVQPICMWKSDKIELSELIGKFGTVVGWGFTENGETSNALQEASMPVVSTVTCLQSNRDLFGRYLTDKNFCAGTRNGTSVCTGDSGGSMTFQENGRFYIRGIVSVGAGKFDRNTKAVVCDAMQYAIFTDVARYLPWITEIVGCNIDVQCDLTENTICKITLTLKDFQQSCKITFDEISGVAVTDLVVFGKGSTAVLDLSDAADKFENLEKLRLKNFKLEIFDRARLSPFRKILELDLSGNTITQLDVDAFVDLSNLKKLNLASNKLTTLPAEIFHNNETMVELVLHSNRLNELHPDVFEQLHNVDILWLSNNELESLPATIFRNNIKMRELHLDKNHLNELHPDVFEKLRNVEVLSLKTNLLTALPANIFRNSENIRELHLDDNRLSELHPDVFEKLRNVEILSLGGNQLETLPANIFRNNGNMRELSLQTNHLNDLQPDTFENLRNVEILSLGGNQLETLPANIFRNNGNMRELNIYSNHLKGLHEDLFVGLKNLERIHLNGNHHIEFIPSGLFRSNAKLTNVHLSHNGLRKIEVDFSIFPQLDQLNLRENDCITGDFSSKDSLEEAYDKIRRNC